ncbi:CDF family Co(II)/Ni(II) efflux transporter DmeF [Rhizobium ruizarguesonis]|jgi:cation diffusion facilitator family transporter|uniref:CDF family Co(II)/Ni(II) efflux transporter DmeF n=1 Tax=Rhizobium ruizarguesonis TaxID=2081791 RepID=UPI00040BD742|nr:CDF family Co(II)/Ni(II) efflux transporter DmeF [Rhizobium ruizarguesonis]MBY5806873.1 CDF family Co(II)/Ni(II) efflux transporter DmeF [Rhizobium leguminosarum]NKL15200.1 CDF family Co(II)/Ni(II) efflux transporter DmeF [Rhizobium leguminosarum bv. viciae]MBY5847102.1 CDF family Co(II)/Ni(II) efflux transporter DmeF [Rhizobium leguminosarum]MBY5852239.1 CDF family Co(II)/Ni(II) efflux transporter DmeF [Rhizobium leguminosarum]MCB2402131.1 CDF family Co(II)/Ni(II) efflux transporter DmeF [
MSTGIEKAGINALEHDHVFLGADHRRNERRIWLVIALTAVMMVAEIAAGTVYGSMALVADGWHMSTHASALLISALAYLFARRQARNPRFTFGTGKLGDLAGFASAIILALIALLMAWESLLRLSNPVPIGFAQAIAVAVIGLAVNLVSAWLLAGGGHDHGHGHHAHGHHAHHSHAHHGHGDHAHHAKTDDNNIRSAYLHVIADALTSVLAIAALTLGSLYGWLWLDPLMGIVGGLVIANWSWSLMKSSGGVLLDVISEGETLPAEIRGAIETEDDRITDLHVWQVGPGHHAAIVAVLTSQPRDPAFYKGRLSALEELSHVTVEVTRAA